MSEALHSINSSLDRKNPSVLLEQLTSEYSGVDHIQEHEALQYLSVMKALRTAKVEVGINKSAVGVF